MAINTIKKVLSIAPDGISTVVRLSQNENGRTLEFKLSDAIPLSSTITLAGTKPDGTVYSVAGTQVDANTVTIDEDTQMTAVSGIWEAKVTITKSGATVATGRIRFEIDADPVDPDAVPSSSQLEGLVAQAEAYAEIAQKAAESYIEYNAIDYDGASLNEIWDAMKTNFTSWQNKYIIIPYPRDCSACVKVGNDWKWKITAPIVFDDACNCANIDIFGELYAVEPVSQVLLFDDAAKPENVNFMNGIQIRGNRHDGNTIGCAIEIRAGARINFFGQTILNDCGIGVTVGGSSQSAPATAFFEKLHVGFFDTNAVYVSGNTHVASFGCNDMVAACAQYSGLSVCEIGEFVNDFHIGQIVYGTDVSKDGYTTNDANCVVKIDGGTKDVRNIRIGLIQATNSSYGLYIDGSQTKAILNVLVELIALQTNGVAVYARYGHRLNIGSIKSDNTVNIANCYNAFIQANMASSDTVDRFAAFATKFRVDTTTGINNIPAITNTDRGTITEVSTAYGTKVYYNTGTENIPFDGQMFVPQVGTLPTAGWQLRGKMYRINNDSGQDIIAVCIRYGGNSYRWFDVINGAVI